MKNPHMPTPKFCTFKLLFDEFGKTFSSHFDHFLNVFPEFGKQLEWFTLARLFSSESKVATNTQHFWSLINMFIINLPKPLQSTGSLLSPRPAKSIHRVAAAPQQPGRHERRHCLLSAASRTQPDVIPGDKQSPLIGCSVFLINI